MRIFLINPPATYEEQTSLVEPMGLCYLSAVAKAAGHEVQVHDMVSTRHADEDKLFAELTRFDPEVVGLTAMTNTFGRALAIASQVKARQACAVVFGGWHVSGDPQAIRHSAIDYVVIGEGEETFLELLGHLGGAGPELGAIPGLAWKREGCVEVNAPRPRIRDLDALPTPDRSGLPVHLYKVPALLNQPLSKMRTLTVQASRGCPYSCTFCQTPSIWGRRWTCRDPVAVVDEVARLREVHGINSFWIRDEEFLLERRWVMKICAELVHRGLARKLGWGSFGRVDDLDPELADALAEAGYCYAFLGIDSGDPEARHRLGKHYDQEQAEQAFRLLRERDITGHGGWIIGFPWDTRAGLERQFSWISSLGMDMLTITYVLPLAGTPLAAEALRSDLIITQDWESFSEKEPVMRVPAIPMEELSQLRALFIRRFYRRPSYLFGLLRRVLRRPARIRIFAEIFWHHLRETRYFG